MAQDCGHCKGHCESLHGRAIELCMDLLMPDTSDSPSPTILRDRILHRFGKGGTLLLAVMAVMLVSAVAFAIKAEKPWGRTVQKRVEKQQLLQPKEYAIIGLWGAAVVNAGVLAL